MRLHSSDPPQASASHSTQHLSRPWSRIGMNQAKIRADQHAKIWWIDAYRLVGKMKHHSQRMSIYYFVGINKGTQFCKK